MSIFIVLEETYCSLDTELEYGAVREVRYVTDDKVDALKWVWNHKHEEEVTELYEAKCDDSNRTFAIEEYVVREEFSGKRYSRNDITQLIFDGILNKEVAE